MSYSTSGRYVKSHSWRPHVHKYFFTITDPDFFPKMHHLIQLYFKQPEYLFCYDECPAIQALMPLYPDWAVDENTPHDTDPSSKRHGATDLMACLRVKNGNIFGECQDNQNRHTLISLCKHHGSMQPSDVQWHYIMDNWNTHFHNDFCQAVAEWSNLKYSPWEKGSQRREWLQKDDKRIVIHFTPFHGSWLNMIEIWFGILNQKCIKLRGFESVVILEGIIWDCIHIWNQYFAHPCTWKYTGDGLHEKAMSRLNTLLLIETTQMDISFLNKQFLLMANIAKEYQTVRQTKQWSQLQDLFILKKSICRISLYIHHRNDWRKQLYSNVITSFLTAQKS